MERLKKITGLSKREEEALWSIFEYMCNEKDEVVDKYIDELRMIARIIDIDDNKFLDMTGHVMLSFDSYLESIYDDF